MGVVPELSEPENTPHRPRAGPHRIDDDVGLDATLAGTGLIVGLLVGLTGMGGGALLTPVLVLVFNVAPVAAVSTDLVTSLIMKPVGAVVHVRRGSVHLPLVGYLAAGAVPAGFLSAAVVGRAGRSPGVQHALTVAIGVVLLASVLASVARLLRERRGGAQEPAPLVVRPALTAGIGVVGGLAVGATSVGAGSLIIALLLVVYPQLTPSRLVGTDIVQAIPLVAAAALGHLLFGQVQFPITIALLVGAVPGVYAGARLSAQAPAAVVRPLVAAVLTASACALLTAPTTVIVVAAASAAVVTVGLTTTTRRWQWLADLA